MERAGNAFVTAAEDGDAASVPGENTGEEFDDGSFAGSADGQVAHADDGAADGVGWEDAALIKRPAPAGDFCVQAGEGQGDGPEEGCTEPPALIEDHLNSELLEFFEGAVRHGKLIDEDAEEDEYCAEAGRGQAGEAQAARRGG